MTKFVDLNTRMEAVVAKKLHVWFPQDTDVCTATAYFFLQFNDVVNTICERLQAI